MNDSPYAASIHTSNCITLHSDLRHMVEMLKTALGTSWKLRRMSRIRNGEVVMLYISATSGWIFMP